jgi:3-phenylpropionate/cinnamic acid dioxygenase small subunit
VNVASLEIEPGEQRMLERFYFHEARLLDNRQYRQWLQLLCAEIRYVVPARVNVQVDNRSRGQEDMLNIDRELESQDSMGCPHREENFILLQLRAERAYKINSWSESPPARTRRLIGNIELMARDSGALSVLSNFHLYYARPGSDNLIYSGQRRDTLRETADGLRITQREVILDYSTIQLPTLGLLF